MMTIRKCPGCAQMTHFDKGKRAPLLCWYCAARVDVDFAVLATPSQTFALRARAVADCALPNPSHLVRVGKVALVVAVPIAAAMLLVCNGFDIFVLRDAAAPFLAP